MQSVQAVDARQRCRQERARDDRTAIECRRCGAARTHYAVVGAYPVRILARTSARGRWQSCPDEDSPERWEGCDVSRERDLCIVCFRDTAGGVRDGHGWAAKLPRDQRRTGAGMGLPPTGPRPAQPDEQNRRRGDAPPEVQRGKSPSLWRSPEVMSACGIGAVKNTAGSRPNSIPSPTCLLRRGSSNGLPAGARPRMRSRAYSVANYRCVRSTIAKYHPNRFRYNGFGVTFNILADRGPVRPRAAVEE